MKSRSRCSFALAALIAAFMSAVLIAADKPPLTLDEFFDAVDFTAVELSPDGRSLVIATERADWGKETFRRDLWLYRDEAEGGGSLILLTQSGRDTDPHWSPDGRWIAFLSDRPEKRNAASGTGGEENEAAQLYLISTEGGEAFPATRGEEEVHAFAWSPDSRVLYFATRDPWSKDQKDAHEKEWKDVLQYRRVERGDLISGVDVAQVLARRARPDPEPAGSEGIPTSEARPLSRTPWRILSLTASPDGNRLAFATTSVSQRQEVPAEFEIYTVDLAGDGDHPPRRVTENEAFEQNLRWAADSRHVFFQVDQGSVEGGYKDTQARLYWVDSDSGAVERWASDFPGSLTDYAVGPDGSVLAAGLLGTEVQVYRQATPRSDFRPLPGRAGTYARLTTSKGSPRTAFVHSALDSPAEVYLAEESGRLRQARAVTFFNKLFTERELPKGKPYRWKADDGTTVEGMLIYPPGRFESRNLPTLTLIHGGPADADGNHFEADWYQWSGLAATRGWLVFQPNYRGSSGYGDRFLSQIVPQIVSRPGKDILEGIDALVKDGIADPDRLAVAGYSYGGYMTNWLITQTTRFKAAMTGAGAVEHVANWGNDDMTVDDAYFLGGRPWEAAGRYHDEAAIFQVDKVRTPTHIVAGSDDIRVAVLENYLLERALYSLGVPCALLVFPGEGHGLGKNPWHGKIKVREELRWLEQYAGPAQASPLSPQRPPGP